ncbi:MAG: hypothetical protein H0V48_00225 [Nocardioidaceae bacterium]|nr:hypothetical protein [Nocardioidaceae bacterium]
MTGAEQCPRCGLPVRRLPDSRWWCTTDGAVAALAEVEEPTAYALLRHVAASSFPTWLPWPMPAQWSLAGVGRAGDPQVQATVSACVAPDPFGGVADLVVVCEEPGVGLGTRYAGVPGRDVGREISGSPPTTRVSVAGHATPLWWLGGGPDRDGFVGEASGRWLWLVAWPASAGALVTDRLAFVNLHDLSHQIDLIPLTGRSRRLTG